MPHRAGASRLRSIPCGDPSLNTDLAEAAGLAVDDERGVVIRPPGVRLDSGGIAKGQAADAVGELLSKHAAYAVDCAGDLRIGGAAGRPRRVDVADPFGGPALEALEVVDGAVATSGVGRRRWRSPDGSWSHHLLDPATGRPCNTGVVRITAVAPTAGEAEVLAKAALLAGPEAAGGWLPHGGVVVLADRTHHRVAAMAAA